MIIYVNSPFFHVDYIHNIILTVGFARCTVVIAVVRRPSSSVRFLFGAHIAAVGNGT